jgi:uncharacterized SAM-binding protein YcdF (DUF218 family)
MDTVFFVLSKVSRIIMDPGNLLMVLLFAGTILFWMKWLRLAKWMLSLACALVLFAILVPVGGYTQTFLENRFPANPPLPNHIDGIIVLGGVIQARVTQARGETAVSGSVDRLIAFADLAGRYPEARLIFTGGSGSLLHQDFKEADYVAPILQKLGMDTQNVIYENQSRNTYENAVYSRELVVPRPEDTWVLITSAAHMPRAVGVFRTTDWPNIIPYPVDFNTIGDVSHTPPLNLLNGVGGMRRAFTEAVGLIAYYLTGKTGTLIPAP